MKRWPLLFIVVGAAALGLALLARYHTRTNFSAPSSAAGTVPILGVERFMKRADDYPGTVAVEGVVASLSPETRLFSLVDVREFRECGLTDCARLALPVRWTGPFPDLKATVRVEGRAARLNGKRVFDAQSLTSANPSVGPAS